MRLAQPNCFLAFDRLGIDPFADRFSVTPPAEGTVRGTDGNRLRRGFVLADSLGALDEVWAQLRGSVRGDGAGLVKVRQSAAMAANARWMYASALARTESRGTARRLDHPGQDPAQHHRIVTGGPDRVWTRPEELAA